VSSASRAAPDGWQQEEAMDATTLIDLALSLLGLTALDATDSGGGTDRGTKPIGG